MDGADDALVECPAIILDFGWPWPLLIRVQRDWIPRPVTLVHASQVTHVAPKGADDTVHKILVDGLQALQERDERVPIVRVPTFARPQGTAGKRKDVEVSVI